MLSSSSRSRFLLSEKWRSLLRSNVLIIVASIYVSYRTGMAIAESNVSFFLLIGLFFAAVLAVATKERMIYFIITVCFLVDYVSYLFGLPRNLIYIAYGSVVFMFAETVLYNIVKGKGIRVNPLLLGWMIYLVLELSVNSDIGILSLQRLLSYLLYPLLFLGLINIEPSERFDRRILMFIVIFVALQIPVVMVQKVVYLNISPDRVGGTLGRSGTPHMAVLLSSAWCFALASILLTKSRNRNINHFVRLLLPFIPVALGNANAGFLLAIGGGIVVYGVFLFVPKVRRVELSRMRALPVLVLPLVLAYLLLNYVLPRFDPRFDMTSWGVISSVQRIIEHGSGYHEGEIALRWEQIRLVSLITKSRLLGSGLGAINYSTLFGLQSERFAEYREALAWATGLTMNYLETGIIGVLLFVLVLVSFALKGMAIVRNSTNHFWQVFSLGFIGAAAIFVVSSVYADPWRNNAIGSSFWICAAVLERIHQRLKNTAADSQPSQE